MALALAGGWRRHRCGGVARRRHGAVAQQNGGGLAGGAWRRAAAAARGAHRGIASACGVRSEIAAST
jgi:hypothetical protein